MVTVLIGQWKGLSGKERVVGDSKCFDWSMEGVGQKGEGSRGCKCFDYSMEGVGWKVEGSRG